MRNVSDLFSEQTCIVEFIKVGEKKYNEDFHLFKGVLLQFKLWQIVSL